MSDNVFEDFQALDEEILTDFFASIEENKDTIEDMVESIEQVGLSDEKFIEIFRHLHSFKGNLNVCFLDPLVPVIHHLESIMRRVRDKELPYNLSFGTLVLDTVENVYNFMCSISKKQEVDMNNIGEWVNVLLHLERCTSDNFEAECLKMNGQEAPQVDHEHDDADSPEIFQLFSTFASLIDKLGHFKHAHSRRQAKLALAMNLQLNKPCDDTQLLAAVYMHNFGMAFIPHEFFDASGNTSDRQQLVQRALDTTLKLMNLFPEWAEATKMIEQHMANFDGTGYPNHLEGDNIHIGSKMIAILDKFLSQTHAVEQQHRRKTLFSAVSEINQLQGSHFDPEIVEVFNAVVREAISNKDNLFE